MTEHHDADASDDHRDSADFSVLIVCTGNLCRSPVAEFLLKDAISRKGHHWTITSAGLAAQDGVPMHRHAADLLAQRRLDVTGWTSQSLSRAAIEDADVILTATRVQAEAVVGVVPSAIMRVFPLRQFARLVSSEAPGLHSHIETGHELFGAANAARTRVATIDPGQDDILDPLRRSRGYFRRRVNEIDQATSDIANRLVTVAARSESAATQ